MANNIARLGVLLGLDAAEFNKGIDNAGRKLDQLAQATVKYGTIAATALTAASISALKYADELADVAQANDVAIGTVLKLSNALANSGGKAEDAGKLLAGFTKFIDTAAEGSLQAQQHLAKMGVSLKDVGNLSTEEIFNKVVQNLAAIEDPLTRNARAMEIFGKAAKGVDFVGIAEEMQTVNSITFEQGQALKQAAEMHDLFAAGARNTMLILASELGPILKTTIGYIKDMTSETNTLGEVSKWVFEKIAIATANATYVIKGMLSIDWNDEEELKKLADVKRRILNPNNGMGAFDVGTGEGWDVPKNEQKRLTKVAINPELEAAKRKQMHLDAMAYANQLRNNEEDAKSRADFFAAYAKGNAVVSERQRLMGVALDNEKEIMLLEMNASNMRQEDYSLELEKIQIKQKLKYDLEQLDMRQDLTQKDRIAAEERQNELAQKAIELAEQRNRLTKEKREGTFLEGFEKNAKNFIRDLPTELENGQRAFESVVGNMEQALTNFVKTGKLSFKDLARSIIQDIIAIQLRAQASGFLSMLIGSFTNPGANGASGNGTGVTGFGSAYADGGSPTPNTVNLVGERGPELFIPKTAGTIIPNNALSGMGGTTNVTNYNINAIDTKSFEERILGSSTAVWAANQYGAKSLATNYGRT